MAAGGVVCQRKIADRRVVTSGCVANERLSTQERIAEVNVAALLTNRSSPRRERNLG